MRTRVVLCAGIVLCLAGTLGAQSTWTAPKRGQWSDPTNWAGDLPSATIKAYFNGPSECTVDIADAAAWQIDLAGGPVKIVDGGVLTVTDWLILGYGQGDVGDNAGHVEVYDGGVLNSNVRFYVGFRGEGFLTVYEGGTVNIRSQLLGVGQEPGGSGVVTLEGGTMNLLEATGPASLHLDLESAEASIDFRGGAMTLPDTTQNIDHLNWAIGDGVIKAYGGIGEVVVEPNETPGRLVVRGVHPLEPSPADDGLASVPTPGDGFTEVPLDGVTLSWKPGMGAEKHDVYFGANFDDVNDATTTVDPAGVYMGRQSETTYALDHLEFDQTYYWRIDEYNTDATISEGRVWSFTTAGAGGGTGDVLTQVVYDQDHTTNGLLLDTGGDVDTEVVSVGSPPEQALRTGNGEVLPSTDGNRVEDYYMQFRIDDEFIFRGSPTSRVQIEIEYLDEGTDTFGIQYDAISGGHEGDGRFKTTGVVVKTNSGRFKTAVFSLCDAYFGNRDNGADFRIGDGADGAEVIRRVAINLLAPKSRPVTHYVDSCGANPYDDQPDSDAIQACIDRTCSGDTVLFTSGVNSLGYQGYIIDKTVFLVKSSGKNDLTFSSTDPNNHALLTASPDLLGFVVGLFARSGIGTAGSIDNITFNHIDLDGNRAERKCNGADGIGNGRDDHWGSWVPECQVFDDAWCSPGTLSMSGQVDVTDPEQDYLAHPERWTTGLVVRDVTLSNTECGTALALWGAACVIDSVIIYTAGDHVHRQGCEPTDPDEAISAWSDGITFNGPAHRIINNLIIDASDIGIVSFGGRDTIIANNTIIAQPGNNGMFAGIAVHPWSYGLLSGFQVVGNHVINEADPRCGGIHVGINIGSHMWGAGCVSAASPSAVGDVNDCSSLSPPPGWTLCMPGQPCRTWGHIPKGATFTLADNTVTGAQVNFLVEGLEVLGELIVSGNVSNSPQLTDWASDRDCTWDGITDSWGALDFVAHDPTIEGWTDQRIYCVR